MKHFVWRWPVSRESILSLCVCIFFVVCADAATRPKYGGVLRVEMREAPTSLDPIDNSQPDSIGRRNLLSLMFERLVTTDDRGRDHPSLATGWESESGNQRWRFVLRKGVTFHDGTRLTPEIAASSLRVANPSWKVFADGDSVVIERDHAAPNLAAELALPRNSIVGKTAGKLSGTGPFLVADWQPGKHLTLDANESYWYGRPFLNSIQIEMGRNFRQQIVDFDAGKADFIEISPEQIHRVAMEGRRVAVSQPCELLALIFTHDAPTSDEKLLRRALALSIERSSIRSVLLQGSGQPSAGLLPNWMTGYEFALSAEADLNLARHQREQSRVGANWTLGYDANDAMAHLLAERIALNARDADLNLQPIVSATVDLRLIKVPLASSDPWVALASLTTIIDKAMPKLTGDSLGDLYGAEQAILTEQRVIPLFHLPAAWASSQAIRDWEPRADGRWQLDEVWIAK